MTEVLVTHVRVARTDRAHRERGLLAFAACRLIGAIEIEGLRVVRSRTGVLGIVFPEREDRHGRRHALVRPVTPEARVAIERAVFAALDLAELGGAA